MSFASPALSRKQNTTGAEDAINVFAAAIRGHLTTDALRQARFACQTPAADIGDML